MSQKAYDGGLLICVTGATTLSSTLDVTGKWQSDDGGGGGGSCKGGVVGLMDIVAVVKVLVIGITLR